MKLKPSAILFDMDGVLVDSLDSWWPSLNIALKAYNQKEIPREEFIEKYWGHDLYDNLERMGLDHKIGTFCNKVYGDHLDKIKIYPETKSILEKLAGYKKGVITNTPKDNAIQILKKFNIKRCFDIVATSDEVLKAKPYPDIIFHACNLLNVKTENVIVVGDTDSDVKAGKAAGCIVIGLNIDADYSIKGLSELAEIIEY